MVTLPSFQRAPDCVANPVSGQFARGKLAECRRQMPSTISSLHAKRAWGQITGYRQYVMRTKFVRDRGL